MNFFRIVSLLIVFLFTGSAFAQQPSCGKREGVVKQLIDDKYDESLKVMGLIDENSVLEFWGNKQTGSWTALVTNAKGITCAIFAGESFNITPEEKPEPPGVEH